MAKISLNQMILNKKSYVHFIDTEDDSTVLEEYGEVLFKVNSDAVLFDRAGSLGKFRTDTNNLWFFECLSGVIIETGNKDLIKAEMKVFKHLLEL
jgi:hypothetical protein